MKANAGDLLHVLVRDTVEQTGLPFFRALVEGLADALEVTAAWVTELQPSERRLKALAFMMNGEWVEDYQYALDGTPCGTAIDQQKLLVFETGILAAYPDDLDLVNARAESYMGVPLFSEDNQTILGHMGIFDTNPMKPTSEYVATFQLFASRAAAELRRLRLEKELRDRTSQLDAVLGSAMDGIIILDDERDIIFANPAAARMLGCEDFKGEMIDRFLSVEGAEKIEPVLERLGEGAAWVPGMLELRNASGEKFAAEGTASSFTLGGRRFVTLILRDIRERLQAATRIDALSKQSEYLREEVDRHFREIIGESAAMRKVIREIQEVAGTDASVLISGETGTGKELVARAVHRASARASEPLVRLNCGAIPSQLIESEFFGHEKGAFTGATCAREGRFALADGGTIFLDEIGELPIELQPKLLRILQEGEFEPVGSSQTQKVNVRVIAATNRDLRVEVEEGRFREDLYYRLSVFPVHVPALRDRENDVTLLARAFVERFAARHGRQVLEISESDAARLKAFSWPGNVRELSNVIERALITSGRSGFLSLVRALPSEYPEESAPAPAATEGRILNATELRELEIANIRLALKAAANRVSGRGGAAELLGLRPSTLSSRIKALGIAPEDAN